MVSSYIDAYQITHDPFFADIARRTCDYVLRDMTSPVGGFYSAEDADSVCIIDHGRVVAIGAPHQVKSELVHETLHIDAADRGALRSRLHALNVPFSEDGHFVVRLDGRTAYEVVHSIDQPLTMLRTESATLEDAYLRLLAAEDA